MLYEKKKAAAAPLAPLVPTVKDRRRGESADLSAWGENAMSAANSRPPDPPVPGHEDLPPHPELPPEQQSIPRPDPTVPPPKPAAGHTPGETV